MKLTLDWSAYKDAGMGDAYADIPKQGGDYAKAIAVCINSGICETHGKQLMCPSFKATDDPDLSTGGRVRLLKQALSSDDWEAAFAEPRLARAMELCVSCKGCKRECENSVDMALIKTEYMAWKNRQQGLSLRSKIFAHTPRWLYRYPQLSVLIRLHNRIPAVRFISRKLLGISSAIPLPEPVRFPFAATQVDKSKLPDFAEPEKPKVVLFVDTFTRYFEPEIAYAAESVLTSAGYQVTTLEAEKKSNPFCCGRTYLAQGMVEEAKKEASRLVKALSEYVEKGYVIVGTEASCVLGLRDDALALGLEEDVKTISSNVLLFEEFLAKENMAKRLSLPFKNPLPSSSLIHGHCHQKAVGAMKSMRRILKLIPNHEFEMIDSGCCGMAGTFSLEAEHYEMGSAMANESLLPTLKKNPEHNVIANGFSCRQQMKAHGDNRPQHLAVLLKKLLD